MRAGGPGWRDWHAQTQRRHRRRSLMRIGAEHERARIEGMLMGLAMRAALAAVDDLAHWAHRPHPHSAAGYRLRVTVGRSRAAVWLSAIRAVRGK